MLLRLASRVQPRLHRALSTSTPVTPSTPLSSNPAFRWAVGSWSFFIAENAILSENREALIGALGKEQYHAFYGTLSTAACASILYGYAYKATAAAPPLLWTATVPPTSRLIAAFALQAVGLIGLSQSLPRLQIPVGLTGGGHIAADAPASAPSRLVVRCPFDFAEREGLHGVQRVSRHAGLWSFGLACLGGAAATASLPQAVCLAMPMTVALLGGAHADSRHRRGMGGTLPAEVEAVTSHVPGVAIALGRQGEVGSALRALVGEMKEVNAALGLSTAALLALRRLR